MRQEIATIEQVAAQEWSWIVSGMVIAFPTYLSRWHRSWALAPNTFD